MDVESPEEKNESWVSMFSGTVAGGINFTDLDFQTYEPLDCNRAW